MYFKEPEADWNKIFGDIMEGSPDNQLKQMMENMKTEDPDMYKQFENLTDAASNIGKYSTYFLH